MTDQKDKIIEEKEQITNTNKEINILTFDIPQNFFEKIFPKNIETINAKFGSKQKNINKSGLFERIFTKNKLKVNWVGYRYPDLNNNNYKEILYDMFTFITSNVAKKFIIIKFGKTFLNEFAKVINRVKADKPLILFNLQKGEEVNEYSFQQFNQKQFVSYYINEEDPNDPDKNYNYIISYLWEKDCYYNELGNLTCQFSPANLLYKKPKGFIFFNILLTGESRAGKSSLINRIFNKAYAFESSKVVSTTQDITHYQLYPQEKNENDNTKKLIEKGYGGINVLDTPGLIESKNINSYKKIKKELDKYFDNLHIIFFFLRKQSNLDNCIDLLKYIKNKNDERIRKKLNKIPIVFIRNGDDLNNNQNGDSFFQHLKNELKKNKLLDLYDNTINQKNNSINNADDLFSDLDNNLGNYSEFVDGNIIQIYLPKGQNMNKIFSITNHYFLNYNKPIFNKDLDSEFGKMKLNTKRLIELFIKEKLNKTSLSNSEKEEYKSLYNLCNNFVQTIRKECSLLYNFDMLNAKSKGVKIAGYVFAGVSLLSHLILTSFTFGLSIIVFFPLHYLSLYFAKKNIISNIACKYGFSDKEINDYGLHDFVYGKDDNSALDENSEKKIRDLFEDILYYIGPIQCLIKARESMIDIYNSFELLSNRNENDWNIFKAEKI